MKTFRYWTWINDGWVKISIRDGRSLSWQSFHRHEEGFSATYETVERIGDRLFCETVNRGRDCDGYTEHRGEYETDITQAEIGELYGTTVGATHGIKVSWKESSAEIFDEYAQRMGY